MQEEMAKFENAITFLKISVQRNDGPKAVIAKHKQLRVVAQNSQTESNDNLAISRRLEHLEQIVLGSAAKGIEARSGKLPLYLDHPSPEKPNNKTKFNTKNTGAAGGGGRGSNTSNTYVSANNGTPDENALR